MNWKAVFATIAVTFAGASTLVVAQDGGRPDRERQRGEDRRPEGERPDRERGNRDPGQWQQRMMERLKEELNAPDDEWGVIQPKLEKVMVAQREARAGTIFGGGRRGPGGPGGGPGPDRPRDDSPVAMAARELRTVLENPNASGEEIDRKLNAYRDARTKANEKLEDARKELREVLTARQEAALVMAGILE
ncbi:MAG: hypothetical protein KatS3mg104_1927 [Phycisphaerae bacterium]|nr:MAG: hypothetical protein KatS3mg104_1927 [Phycisphaerae bacterium]